MTYFFGFGVFCMLKKQIKKINKNNTELKMLPYHLQKIKSKVNETVRTLTIVQSGL